MIDIYEPCDKAIKALNRSSLALFGKLKLAKFDQLNVIREVRRVYEQAVKEAKRRFYEVAFEAYVLELMMCDIDARTAHRMAEKAITEEWVNGILTEPDFVTLYRFDTETERKMHRLDESLAAIQDNLADGAPKRQMTAGSDAQVDNALKQWSKQIGQYAIIVTDYAVEQAIEDAGIRMAMWVTAKDERVCHECKERDGKVYPLDEFPTKPHYGCRCRMVAVKG